MSATLPIVTLIVWRVGELAGAVEAVALTTAEAGLVPPAPVAVTTK